MALGQGNAGFKWTDPGGTPQTLTLQHPPFIEHVEEPRTRWAHERTAFGEPEVWTAGSDVAEIRLRLRFHDDGSALVNFVEDAADGIVVDYYQDLADSTTQHPSLLIEPREPMQVRQDQDRFSHGEYEATVLLRHATGGDYRSLL